MDNRKVKLRKERKSVAQNLILTLIAASVQLVNHTNFALEVNSLLSHCAHIGFNISLLIVNHLANMGDPMVNSERWLHSKKEGHFPMLELRGH